MTPIPSKTWPYKRPPKKVLAIRLQAMGDTVITLPYLQDLRRILPSEAQLDFLTRKEVEAIPQALALFGHVYAIGGGRSFKRQLLAILMLLPILLFRRYEVVIDLQNNRISRLVRRCLFPRAWSGFDRYSPLAAGERTKRTVEAVGLGNISLNSGYIFKKKPTIEPLLLDNGWNGKSKLVILNPAGAFPTRNWDIENYAHFAHLWMEFYPDTQFVVTGLSKIRKKADVLKAFLGDKVIDLVEKSSALEAFYIIQKAEIMLSEDSGLMHMAWVSEKPTVALLGSTRSDWVRPQNRQSMVLGSDDLPCGNCMLAACPFGDVHCLSRYTPDMVFYKIQAFLRAFEEQEESKICQIKTR